jgi:hypothetical protein
MSHDYMIWKLSPRTCRNDELICSGGLTTFLTETDHQSHLQERGTKQQDNRHIPGHRFHRL